MTRNPHPPRGPAGDISRNQYYREGRCRLESALRDFPGLKPEEALIEAQLAGGSLDPSSVTKYRADLRRILMVILRFERRSAAFEDAWVRLDTALGERKQNIPDAQKRTSARKVEDATDAEARALFCELKRHALKNGNMNAVLACLYVLVAGHAGFRPIEVIGASLLGTKLTVPNAKRQPGQAATRSIDIGDLDQDVISGIALLLSLTPPDMRRAEFRAWHKTLAQQMWRACERIGADRILSPYSFRHVAIASWSRAGVAPDEIARLSGHISIRTHHQHYARAKVGHKRRAVARSIEAPAPVASQMAPPLPELSGVDRPVPFGEEVAVIDLDDFPIAIARRAEGQTTMGVEEIRARLNRYVDPRTVDEIERSLRAGRLQREVGNGDIPTRREGKSARSVDKG